MSSNRLKNLYPNFTRRRLPKYGPVDANVWNASVDELSADIDKLNNEWNKLVILTNGLPNGSKDTSVDAFLNSIDGKNLWVDTDVTSSSNNTTYYNSNSARPSTIKESLDNIYTSINTAIVQLQEEIAANSVALTDTQKSSIGANIFDSTQTSSSLSLDGKSENNRLNTIQLAKDIYDDSYYKLDNDGASNLSYSLRDMISELLDLHSGSWGSNPAVINHTSAVVPVPTQIAIGNSSSYDDSFTAVPGTLEDDLNQLRAQINLLRGTFGYTNLNSELYVGGPDSLEDLLSSTSGTGVKTPTNPWGYDISDFWGALDVYDIVGMDEDAANIIKTTTVASGLPNFIEDGTINEVFSWMVNIPAKWDGIQFRRLETGISGAGPFDVHHGRGAYPIVDVIQIDPSVTTSGQYLFSTEHNSINDFTITYPAGVSLTSGVIVSVW